jgi:D-sedoheptulose 7-phosphate isomerase
MSLLTEHIEGAQAALESLRAHEAAFDAACELLAESLRAGHLVLACGNGGSAADSGHFTTELLCRFVKDRAPLPALSLTQDGGFLTAMGNDYGYEAVFARQVEGLGKAGDVLVAFSTSGRSPSIVRALQAARQKQLCSVALLGRDGGDCRGLADVEIIVPGPETARIQEAHQVLIHAFCAGIERRLFPDLYA